MKVLLVEDDHSIRAGLKELLEREGYVVCDSGHGDEALALFKRERPDFVCLDIMLPGKSGFELCKHIRRIDEDVPVIFISAKGEEIDRLLGFELGADDFIVKPFSAREVVARVRAITRRSLERGPRGGKEPFELADLIVHPDLLMAKRGEQTIELSLRDVVLLELFASCPGKVLDRDTLLDHAWGKSYVPNSRTLDQHIAQLRKKIERDPKHPLIIQTIHGAGYRYGGGAAS